MSLPPQSFLGSLSDCDHAVAPLDGGHGDRPGLVPDSAAGGGEDDPLLSGFSFYRSLPSFSWS